MESNKKKILVLEDEKALSRALELKLTHEGFEVKTGINGDDLLSVLSKDKYSLIICDLLMPKTDGFQVLQLLKDNNMKIPVIVLTNLSQAEDERKVRELGAVEYFVKSDIPISEVVEKVKVRIAK
ncbi:MAG: response regulator [Candidatus Taylorbacteria bacterium]